MTEVEVLERYNFLKKRYFAHIVRTLVRIIETKDKYTCGHSDKVMHYCHKMAKALQLDPRDSLTIKMAALLHDIGKFVVEKSILNKEGKLTPEEWREIKKHPVVGANIVKETGILSEVADIIKYHHQHFGGGGYPDSPKKRGKDIPLGSRIIAIADSYDAMTSKRAYRKKPMTKEEAIAEIKRKAGTQFDPLLVNLFVSAI